MRERWNWSVPVAASISGFFVVVDLVFFSANLLKIAEGGWIPLLAGLVVFTLMTTWRAGILAIRRDNDQGIITPMVFLDRIKKGEVPRVPGTAVFLTRATRAVPPIMAKHIEQFGALPRSALSLTVIFEDVPRMAEAERLQIETVADRMYHLTIHYGFVEIPDLAAALKLAHANGCEIDLGEAVFFGSRDDVVRSDTNHSLSPWRLMIFSFLYRNSVHMVDRFNLDAGSFVEIGRRVEI